MVEFGSGYYMPMDRNYSSAPREESATNDVGVGIGDIGASFGLGPIPNIPTIGARLRGGTKVAELTFMGAGKGSGQGHTPEMYGEMQRQALREMQKANDVHFTTHATVGVYGMAGMDQQGNFSRHQKGMAVDEIKRAIDFAADVANGGSVVVHTGEFHRPIAEAEWNKDKRFRMFEKEEETTAFKVVDTRTGGVIQEARKNRAISKPVWNTAAADTEYTDFNGRKKKANSERDEDGNLIYLDYWNKRIERADRVPKYDNENKRFMTHQVGWQELTKEAEDMTREAQKELQDYRSGKLNDEQVKRSPWIERFKDVPQEKIKVRPEEAYIISTLETNAANSRGWAHYYGGEFNEYVEKMEKLVKAKELYKQIEASVDPEEKWKLKQQAQALAGLIPEEGKMPTEIIQDNIDHIRRQINYSKESSASQWAQSEEQQETIRYVESAETYALREAKDAYAQAGIQAMLRSMHLEKKGQLKKPIFISMENLYPETYGGHPEELIPLVKGAQETMQKTLQEKYHLSAEEAKKKAQDHIGATFDTGHFNMWRKYWRGDPDKNIEQNEEAFNKWFLGQVESLAKSGIVKHLHIVDNYGYQDEHLAPGQGNTPIKKAIEIFKKHGYKGELIVEAGADYSTDSSGFQTLTKAWKYFGQPVYGTPGGVSPRSWSQVQYGYLGQNEPPYFMFTPYAPTEDWTLWTGAPLE